MSHVILETCFIQFINKEEANDSLLFTIQMSH